MSDEARSKEQLLQEVEQLRLRVSDLEKLDERRKRAEEELGRHAGELALLASTTKEFLQFPVDGDIYGFIASRLLELAPEALIAVTRLDEKTGELTAAALLGLGNKFDTVTKIVGYDPYKVSVRGSPKLIEHLSRGKLVEFPGGVYDITSGNIPRIAAKALEKLFGFSQIYVMGFENEGRLVGSVVILPKKGRGIENRSLIEAFVGQAAVALEHRRAEEALRESEARLRLIADRIDDVFWITDWSNHATVFASPAFERIWGRRVEDLLRNATEWADAIHPDDRQMAWDAFVGLEANDSYDEEYRITHPDGSLKWIWDRGLPIRNAEGRVTHVVGIATDITGRKQAEEENVLLQAQFQHAQKMEAIGRLAGGVAHDINNMLSGIMGYASLMQMDLNPGDQSVDDIQEILNICKSARELTGNLLGFARKGKYRKERIDFDKSIGHVLEILERTILKKIEIETRFATNLPEIEGDSGQIEQVMMNLLINAADAMGDPGKLTITTGEVILEETEIDDISGLKPGRHVQVTIADTGEGMDAEILAKAFEPFFTTKSRGQGTGLGLSMVYGTVRNHSGTVTLDSELGRGTTVTMLFPVMRPGSDLTSRESGQEHALVTGHGTILLVDDEDTVRRSTGRLLKRAGYQVVQAGNGEEAMEVYREKRAGIDLVLLDMVMPMMDGKETFHKLKEINPGVKVLLLSGFSPDATANRLMAEGAIGFIQKPFLPKDLSDRVAKALLLS